MQYEDIVYKAGILAMAVRLEKFLEDAWKKRRKGKKSRKAAQPGENSSRGCPEKRVLVDEFVKTQKFANAETRDKVKESMNRLFKNRNDIAHPPDQGIAGEHFEGIRDKCLVVDNVLENMNLPPETLPRMGEVMISCSLRYDMGNAGDIIKHGVLAEFAEWWDGGELRFADPFGGRPWGVAKKEVREQRVWPLRNSGCALWRAQEVDNRMADGGLEKYYGSSHVVLNAAKELATVFASDSDKLTRKDLQAAGKIRELRGLQSALKLIDDEVCGYESGNGYSILDHAHQLKLDLVLIDPYADFLRDELALREKVRRGHESEKDGHFSKIENAILHNENLWIAVFVLIKDEEIDAYEELREKHFEGRFIALRCPRFPKRKVPAGENRYNMEILLVSSCLATKERHTDNLRKSIAKFKDAAEYALGKGKIRAWGLEEENA